MFAFYRLRGNFWIIQYDMNMNDKFKLWGKVKLAVECVGKCLVICMGFYVIILVILSSGADILYSIAVLSHLLDKTMTLESAVMEDFPGNTYDVLHESINLSMDNKDYPLTAGDAEIETDLDMGKCIRSQGDMISKLRKVKREHDLKYFDVDGALEVELPSNISQEETSNIVKRVGVIDRIIQSKFDEYDKLSKYDIENFNGRLTKEYSRLAKDFRWMYNTCFEKKK